MDGEDVSRPEAIDWHGLIRLGMGALRLPPDQFWSMTPTELILALEGAGLRPIGGVGMKRGTLDRLMQAHPDQRRGFE